MTALADLRRDATGSAVTAGFVAVVVGAASSIGLLVGLFAGWVVRAVGAVPAPAVAALVGLAPVSTTLSSVTAARQGERGCRAAFVTLAVTASGVTALGLGVGSAVWGRVLAGGLLWALGQER